jgi:crotonobetainyl-CoA hydratase/dehydration protein DpgD
MPIDFERQGHVATITIRGYNQLNPITQEMYLELHERFSELDDQDQSRVAILRGAGERHFSVGGDLKRHQAAADPLTPTGHLRAFWYPSRSRPAAGLNRVTLFSRRTATPLIAAINGYCLGGAFITMCLHSSLRVAGESAQFGFAESRLGLGGVSVAARLADQIPYAAHMLLTASGRFISARDALRIGLVNSVVPDDEVFDRAADVAAAISRLPPMTLRAEKAALFHAESVPYRDAIALGNVLEVLNLLSPDALEGLSALREGRTPIFSGLHASEGVADPI